MWRGVARRGADLMNAFVYGLAVKRWTDVAVITPAGQLDFVKCTAENGAALSGFDCLFKPMPHVCTFSSKEVRKTSAVGAPSFGPPCAKPKQTFSTTHCSYLQWAM